jgi:hypothetical protein
VTRHLTPGRQLSICEGRLNLTSRGKHNTQCVGGKLNETEIAGGRELQPPPHQEFGVFQDLVIGTVYRNLTGRPADVAGLNRHALAALRSMNS